MLPPWGLAVRVVAANDRHPQDIVSVAERTRLVAAGGAVVAFTFSGEPRSSVLSEEALAFAEPDGEMRRMAIHDGAILVMAADGERIVSGGDDGKAVTTDAGSPSCDGSETSLDRSHRCGPDMVEML